MLLQNLVAAQARRQPDATAVVHGNQSITYQALDETASRIAYLLHAEGCKPGDRVGLLLPKTIPAVAAMLGSLKAGCTYVPLDIGSPAARIEKILDASEPAFLLACAASSHLLDALLRGGRQPGLGWLSPSASLPRYDFSFCLEDLASVPAVVPEVPDDASTPAHILFTSGSTGVPKGVVITHANILAFIEWATEYFGMQENDRVSCHPPLHFDLSMFDIYGTFRAGGLLYLVPPEISLLPQKVADFIRGNALTQWFSVPSVLKYMAQHDVVRPNDFPALRRLLWCGEALPTPVLMYFMRRLPHVSFTNLYGPTETTIASSYYTVPRCPDSEKSEIPIGRPCAGEDLLVLDEALRSTPFGEIGDLYITGSGLSPGYWRDPAMTSKVFLTDPARGRLYRTGDLARVGEDGLVYLLGRADSQIKSRGYRIELGEIESALYTLGIMRECAVVAVPSDGFEGMTICCAYVPEPGKDLPPVELRARLADLLPSYMLPSQWMRSESLPLNGNGKVDRPRLREQFQARSAAAAAHGGIVCSPQRH